MTRLAELRARREQLLRRCAAQRAELARRIAELRPGRAGDAPLGADGSEAGRARHPLAWMAVLGGLMLIGRAREVLSLLQLVRSAVALGTRATQLLRALRSRPTSRTTRAAAAAAAGPPERA